MPAHTSWLLRAWLASWRTVHGAQFVTPSLCVSSSVDTTRRSSSSAYSSVSNWSMSSPLSFRGKLAAIRRPTSLTAVPGPLPAGTVSFLFNDIEDATPLWEEMPAEMAAAVEAHDGITRATIEGH